MLSKLSHKAHRLIKVLKIADPKFESVCPILEIPVEDPISSSIFARFLPAFDLRVAVFGRF